MSEHHRHASNCKRQHRHAYPMRQQGDNVNPQTQKMTGFFLSTPIVMPHSKRDGPYFQEGDQIRLIILHIGVFVTLFR